MSPKHNNMTSRLPIDTLRQHKYTKNISNNEQLYGISPKKYTKIYTHKTILKIFLSKTTTIYIKKTKKSSAPSL